MRQKVSGKRWQRRGTHEVSGSVQHCVPRGAAKEAKDARKLPLDTSAGNLICGGGVSLHCFVVIFCLFGEGFLNYYNLL